LRISTSHYITVCMLKGYMKGQPRHVTHGGQLRKLIYF
jgi:hypothetical protein